MMLVREATPADAVGAVELLHASITELCVADHGNDASALERWLANKTVAHWERWVRDPNNSIFVAERAGQLLGVGLVNRRGRIHLCYVRPGRTRSGAGRALLEALEAQAARWGLTELGLTSTREARGFYERRGYVVAGEPSLAFGVIREYPYRKVLNE